MQKIKNRTSSNKERKQQKSSPIRTTKISNKEMGVTQYFSTNGKGSTGNAHKKVKGLNTGPVRAGQAHPVNTNFKASKYQSTSIVKGNNLSLNNFKTEIKLPHAQKFLTETQFVKSPFLSKTLKVMMQGHPANPVKESRGNGPSNYGRLGNSFQTTTGRRKRDPSAHSNKSKRETSGSYKKGSKQNQKLMNTKK